MHNAQVVHQTSTSGSPDKYKWFTRQVQVVHQTSTSGLPDKWFTIYKKQVVHYIQVQVVHYIQVQVVHYILV